MYLKNQLQIFFLFHDDSLPFSTFISEFCKSYLSSTFASPALSRTEYIMTFDNKCAQITFTFMHSLQNLSPSSKNSKVWQVLGGLFTHLPPTPNTRWPPKPPSWCTRFKGGYPGLRPSPCVSLLDCKDDDVEERVALQAGLDGDHPAASGSHSRHCIAGHYQGDATSLDEETPPRTGSSNDDDVGR